MGESRLASLSSAEERQPLELAVSVFQGIFDDVGNAHWGAIDGWSDDVETLTALLARLAPVHSMLRIRMYCFTHSLAHVCLSETL